MRDETIGAAPGLEMPTGEPIAVAKGVVGDARREIILSIYERGIRRDNGQPEETHPATLWIAGSEREEAATLRGTLRGLGERRSLVMSILNPSYLAHGTRVWADILRAKWLRDAEEVVGVYVPVQAATRLGAMYRQSNRITDQSAHQLARQEVERLTVEFGQRVRMWPEVGVMHFDDAPVLDARRRTGPRMG